MTRKISSVWIGIYAAIMTSLLLSACKIDSANSVSRTVNAIVTGVYRNTDTNMNNGRLVSANTGNAVTSLDVRQAGDQLEAIDNNGIIFRGTIGNVSDNAASFNLEGRTTAGNRALISGNIQIGGGQGVMRATWIEDTLYGTVFGVANGPTVVTNIPSPNPTNTNNLVFVSLPPELWVSVVPFAVQPGWIWLTES
ncbi:MAG TPA: hypothetical protein PJ991_05320 [Kiritimatiellia bacterium]|nr:hypothetical protein [Kiritimatiellia bacterium]